MDRHSLIGLPRGWIRLAAISVLVLVAFAAHLQVSSATGIDFDLNEPAPVDPDDEVAQVEMEFDPPVQMTTTTTTTPAPPGRLNRLGKHRKCASEGHGGGLSGWAKRIVSRLPNYFDFSSFRGKFKRAYKASETHLRESVFVKKCLEVFRSRVSYRQGGSSYLKTINKFSDKTPEEFSQIYMVAPPIENYQNGEPEQQQQQLDIKDYLKNVEERKKKLERERQLAVGSIELESQSSLDNLGCSLDGSGSTFGGQLMEKAQQEIDLLLSHSMYELEDEQLASAIYDELNDAAMEKVSQSAASSHIDEASSLNLPWPGMSASGGGHHNNNNDQLMIEKELDWSKHECFHSVYDQGTECGKCYVMATTSLAEFYKCTELGPSKPVKKRQFSKDYVLNCAPKYSATIMGCAGGSMLNTLRFMALAGVYNIRGWQQFRQESLRSIKKQSPFDQNSFSRDDLKCPLDQYQTPFEKWGQIKVKLNPQVLQKPADKEERQLVWLEALQDGPLVVSVQMPSEGVDSYAEGIHDGAGCGSSGHWHAMILVGYGQDDTGKSYWRFRNSFGPDWGMQGHFHLSADVPEACFGAAVRVYREPLSVPDEKESPK